MLQPIQLISSNVEVAKAGKVPAGKTEIPFEFPLNTKGNKVLYETYHGVFVNIQVSGGHRSQRHTFTIFLTDETDRGGHTLNTPLTPPHLVIYHGGYLLTWCWVWLNWTKCIMFEILCVVASSPLYFLLLVHQSSGLQYSICSLIHKLFSSSNNWYKSVILKFAMTVKCLRFSAYECVGGCPYAVTAIVNSHLFICFFHLYLYILNQKS